MNNPAPSSSPSGIPLSNLYDKNILEKGCCHCLLKLAIIIHMQQQTGTEDRQANRANQNLRNIWVEISHQDHFVCCKP